MELGPYEQAIAKQAFRAGQPLPERIQNAPELRTGLQLYIQAFFDLDSERSHAMGLVAIPWSSINEYAKAFDFDDEQKDCLFFFIRRLDASHLKRLEAKNKANDKKPSRPRKSAK